jgi:hypothetical protein
VQDPKTQTGIPERLLQAKHPLTWSYLKKFEALLRARKAFQKFFDPKRDAFYSMYAVSEYTFAPHKVVWMDVSATMKAVVVSRRKDEELPIPEHKLLLLTASSAEEAHFVASILNSEVVGTTISGYVVDNSISTHPIENIAIPKYDPSNKAHTELAALSRAAHRGVAKEDEKAVAAAEAEINAIALRLW